MKKRIFLFAVLTFALLAAGCAGQTAGANGDPMADGKINAAATTSIVADLVRSIGGERVEVTALMGAGVDPHLYKASAGDVTTLERAEIIFYNGLHLEAAMANVLEQMGERGNTVAAVTDLIDRSVLFTPPQFQGNYDPHVWFDVSLWMKAAEQVREALTGLDPAGAEAYQANTDEYLQQMQELDDYVRQQVERVPEDRRVIVTAHDAFNYFGEAYGFEVVGLQGISTASEASTADVQDLAVMIAERQIPAIFVESSVPRRNVEAVQAAVEARGHQVEIGGQLFSDALGDPGTPEGTYLGMVRANVDTIVQALAGSEE